MRHTDAEQQRYQHSKVSKKRAMPQIELKQGIMTGSAHARVGDCKRLDPMGKLTSPKRSDKFAHVATDDEEDLSASISQSDSSEMFHHLGAAFDLVDELS